MDAAFNNEMKVPPQLLQQLDDWQPVSLQREAGVHLKANHNNFVAATPSGADAIHLPSFSSGVGEEAQMEPQAEFTVICSYGLLTQKSVVVCTYTAAVVYSV